MPWRQPSFARHFFRVTAYVLLSAGSGVAWAWLLSLIGGNGRPRQESAVLLQLLFGAISGLIVGVALNWFYRSDDWRHAVYAAPLALWLGAYSFIVQNSLYHDPGSYLVFLSAALVVTFYLIPFFWLILFSIINGLLLRLVFVCCPDDEPW